MLINISFLKYAKESRLTVLLKYNSNNLWDEALFIKDTAKIIDNLCIQSWNLKFVLKIRNSSEYPEHNVAQSFAN